MHISTPMFMPTITTMHIAMPIDMPTTIIVMHIVMPSVMLIMHTLNMHIAMYYIMIMAMRTMPIMPFYLHICYAYSYAYIDACMGRPPALYEWPNPEPTTATEPAMFKRPKPCCRGLRHQCN